MIKKIFKLIIISNLLALTVNANQKIMLDETDKITDVLEQMRNEITYRDLSSNDYIWAPYAETNYDDFLRIITIACAGVSRDDFIHFNMPVPVEFDEKVRVKGDASFLKANNIDLNNTTRKLLSPPTERKSRIQRDFPEGTQKIVLMVLLVIHKLLI